MRATRVHHASRRCGDGVAAGGARAAGGRDAAHRRADECACGRSAIAGPPRGVPPRKQESGWAVGRNLQVDTRWGAGDAGRLRKYAAELVALAPDVILAGVGATTRSLQGASRTVPIVFAESIDPVGAGFVASLARPGGNTTGFIESRIRYQREMAGVAQADRAARDASGGPSRFRLSLRDRAVGRTPGRGPVSRGGSDPGRRARRRRDRAGHHGVCARLE